MEQIIILDFAGKYSTEWSLGPVLFSFSTLFKGIASEIRKVDDESSLKLLSILKEYRNLFKINIFKCKAKINNLKNPILKEQTVEQFSQF